MVDIPQISIDSAWLVERSTYSDYLSEEFPKESNIVIIGTGFTGVATAYHILNSYSSTSCVTLLEARGLCSGATSRNGGHLTADIYSGTLSLLSNGFSPRQVVQFAEFEIDNYHSVIKLIEDEDLECEFAYKEHYNAAFSREEFETSKRNVEMMRKIGGPVSKVRIYENPEATDMLGMKCEGLIVHSYAASVHPYKMVTGLLSNLFKKFGERIKLFTHTLVERVDENNTIHTERGNIKADKIVYAINGYAPLLLPQMQNIIIPIRGQVIQSCPVNKYFPNCSFNDGGEYLSQRPNKKLILGGARRFSHTAEIDTIDDSMTHNKVSEELKKFCQMLGGQTIEMEWTGIMGFTKFGIPVVKEIDGGVICAGFSGHGMTRIFLSAKETARRILLLDQIQLTPSAFNELRWISSNDVGESNPLQ